ncbi:MAG: ATP-grasp domain-containing protein [Pseudomonadota bacterium]
MGRVLILDGHERSALAAVRSLGRRLEAVVASESRGGSLAARSRYAAAGLCCPSPAHAAAEFQAWLTQECERGGYEMVLPLTDVSVPLVLQIKDRLERWTKVPFVDLATYEAASDKRRLLELAERLGVPTPRSIFARQPAELAAGRVEMDFPLVIKPQRSKTLVEGRVLETGPVYVRSAAELRAVLTRHPVLSRVPVIVQERIEGQGIGLFALYQEGRPVRLFAHRRLMEKPPSGGVSVLCESIHLEADAREQGLKLLSALGWHGAAMVEWRRSRQGALYLMEINARFWGSLQLAVDAGVDFPYDLYRLSQGTRLDPTAGGYRVGRRCGWLLGLVDHYYLRLKKRQLRAGGWPRPWKWPHTADFVWRLDDPRPFWWELTGWLGRRGR